MMILEYFDAYGLRHLACGPSFSVPKESESLACEVVRVAQRLWRSRWTDRQGAVVCTAYMDHGDSIRLDEPYLVPNPHQERQMSADLAAYISGIHKSA